MQTDTFNGALGAKDELLNMISMFRVLLLSALVLHAAFIVSFLCAYQLFGQDVASVVYHNGKGAWIVLPHYAWMVDFTLWSLATLGMILCQRWARTFFYFSRASRPPLRW